MQPDFGKLRLPQPLMRGVMCAEGLTALSKLAKSLGAHAPLKKQPDGSFSLFVYLDEIPNNFKSGATTWNYLIVIDEVDSRFDIRFSSTSYSRQLELSEAKTELEKWIKDTTDDIARKNTANGGKCT
jgi:hypothetical protein